MISMIDPAREGVIVESAASTFEPGEQTAPGGLEELELNGAAGFLLNYDGSRANPAAADKVADLDLDDVAPAQLAVDREIEHRAVAKPALSIKPKPDGPDLLGLQRPFGSEFSACVPRPLLLGDRIIL
jgi:hypothetical protein